MSDLSLAYMFGGQFSHTITCISGFLSTIITGSSTGEIVYWKRHENYTPKVFCTVPSDSACISICVVPASIEMISLCGVQLIVVSLHEKCKIRTWDLVDGKCLAYSSDLFPESSDLTFLARSIDNYIMVAGKNELHIIDVYNMQKVKYFSTERKILSINCYQDKLYIQCISKFYIFNLENSSIYSPTSILENWVNVEEKTFIDSEKDIILIGNSFILQIILKDSNGFFSIQKLKLQSKIYHLALVEGIAILALDACLSLIKLSDLASYHKDPSKIPVFEKFSTDLLPSSCGMVLQDLVLTNGKDIKIFNILNKNFEVHKCKTEKLKFDMLHTEEIVTVYGIFIDEDILLAIGTDIGRVILTTSNGLTVAEFYNKNAKITALYLHKGILAVGYIDESLAFWGFKHEKGHSFNRLPLKTIDVWGSYFKSILPIKFCKRNIDCFNEMSWKGAKANWKDLVLAQCGNGTLAMISFEKLEILTYFHVLAYNVTKAKLFLNIDYLAVRCTNGKDYIFNISFFALERETVKDEHQSFDIIEIVDDEDLKRNIERNDYFTACYEYYFAETVKKRFEVKYVYIGYEKFPVLLVNLVKVINEKPNMIKMIGPLLSCSILKSGIYGKSKAFAFKNDQVFSPYLNSIKLASIAALGLPLPQALPFDTLLLITISLSPTSNFRTKLLDYISFTPQSLYVCEGILMNMLKDIKSSKKNPKYSLTDISNEKYHSQRIALSIPQALATAVLSCACIKSQYFNISFTLELLILMIKSSDEGFILLACELLARGISIFKSNLDESQVEELIKEFLLYSCKPFNTIPKDYFYRVATIIGLPHMKVFIKTLSSEIQHGEIDSKYQQQVFYTIEYLILHHYLEATSSLEELGNFILKANEIKQNLNNKAFDQDFIALLQTYAGLLPMVSLSFDSRLLIEGLPTGWLHVYDLKKNKRWKPIKIFATIISAVDVKDKFIGCYSSQESCVKTVKIGKKIFGSIVGKGKLRVVEKINLEEVELVASSYQELIKNTRLRWVDIKTLSLVRENKKEYLVVIKKYK